MTMPGADTARNTEVPRLYLVLSTMPDEAAATQLARKLIDERLIACANLLPGLRSIYRWQGEVRSDAEVLLLLKTAPSRLQALIERVQELHPYDVPECIAFPAETGLAAYCQWVAVETESQSI
jgi:periplasmic divalent cation tolerance protein